MKKVYIILICIILLTLLTACKPEEISTDVPVNNSEILVNTNELYLLSDYERAIKLLDEKIKSTSYDESLVDPKEGIGIVKLEKITDTYYLGSYYGYPVFPKINLNYALVDIMNNVVNLIKLDDLGYINDVYFEDNLVNFIYEGDNIINAFKRFPYKMLYDIEKNEIYSENIYFSLEQFSKVQLGNNINKIGLDTIAENNKEILFNFKEIENTILAGGDHCPEITVGISKDRKLFIDFENLVLSDENKEDINKLEENDYIDKIEIRQYKDANEENHLVIYLTLTGIKKYTCKFETHESSVFQNFVLVLQ